MKTNKFYETPVVDYLDAENEGVLCQSSGCGIEINDWTQGSGSIDF